MRILIVTHVVAASNNGQGRVNYEIVRAALAAGHHVTIVASETAAELLDHPAVRFVCIPVSRLPSRLIQHQVFALRSANWIRAHRREFDLVHLNGFITWTRSDVNTVHFVHRGWHECGFYPFKVRHGAYATYQVVFTRLNAWLEKWAFRNTRVIVPVSRKVGAEIKAIGIDDARLHVIHNGVDIDEFSPGPAQRARFRLPEDAFLLLFAGDLRVPRKNLDGVLHALVSTPAHVHLVVAGFLRNSPYPALAQKLGVSDRVHFVGQVTDVPAMMRSVDVFVFPSRYEAMSLVMLEALASALPVVTASTAGGAEVIDHTAGVVLESPEDITGLAAAIGRLASDAGHARAMGAAARELAKSLSWQTMAAHYLSLYDELVAHRERHVARLAASTASARP